MNKKAILAPIALLGVFAITACGGTSSSSSSSVTPDRPKAEVGYKQSRIFFENLRRADKQFDFATYADHGEPFLPSHGNPKELVVPILFKDEQVTEEQIATRREQMRRIFFGTPEETCWQSVKSYYETSSYGRITLGGEVAQAITLNETWVELQNKDNNVIIEEIYDKLFTSTSTYTAPYAGREAEFDSNDDGVMDGIFCIPDCPIDSSSTFGWAWKTLHYFKTKFAANKNPQYKRIGVYS